MLRFVRDVENWGGVQGTSWVASTEIAAMSWSLRLRFGRGRPVSEAGNRDQEPDKELVIISARGGKRAKLD